TCQALAGKPADPQQALPPQAAAAEAPSAPPGPGKEKADPESNDKAVTVSGRVLDPDGKPFAGAKVYLWTRTSRKLAALPVRATTAEDGRFSFTVTATEREQGKVVATAGGNGPDWAELEPESKEEMTLRLAKDDVPVGGRIIDLEGRPIAGVTIEVTGLDQGENGDLQAWFKAKKGYAYFEQKHLSGKALDCPTPRTAGEGGRVRPSGLRSGLGRERVVYLRIRGPNIENGLIHVVTTTGDVPGERTGFLGVFPASFDYPAGPSKPIIGTVRDKATGKPLAGITVAAMQF